MWYFAWILGLPLGTIKSTVLIETLPGAFMADEILFELRDHIVALNCGRWDYIFSYIKSLSYDPARILPDRAAVNMTVPFMAKYAAHVVRTCHKRGAPAIGGMSAFIPNRRDPEATERTSIMKAQTMLQIATIIGPMMVKGMRSRAANIGTVASTSTTPITITGALSGGRSSGGGAGIASIRPGGSAGSRTGTAGRPRSMPAPRSSSPPGRSTRPSC